MSCVSVILQAQHIFCGSVSLHRPGEKYWWEGGGLNKATSLPPNVTQRAENHGSALFTTDIEKRDGLVGGAGQDSALFLRIEVGEEPSQQGKHFFIDMGNHNSQQYLRSMWVHTEEGMTGT